jgi:hypothetical protein
MTSVFFRDSPVYRHGNALVPMLSPESPYHAGSYPDFVRKHGMFHRQLLLAGCKRAPYRFFFIAPFVGAERFL